jgi:hypothetical protein
MPYIGSGHLGQHIDTLLRLAEQLPVRSLLQANGRRRVELGGCGRDLAIGHAAPAGIVADDRARHFQFRCRNAQLLRRRSDHHLLRHRAGLPHLVESVTRRSRAAGALQPQHLARGSHRGAHRLRDEGLVVKGERPAFLQHSVIVVSPGSWPVLDADRVQFHLQLFGDQRGQRGRDALTHFGARHDHRNRVVSGDLHERIESRLAVVEFAFERIGVRLAHIPSPDRHPAGKRRGADQECSARDFPHARHGSGPRRL